MDIQRNLHARNLHAALAALKPDREKKEMEMTKTVLITGCSSGIGRAAARLFAAHGWNVAATMRNPAAETELRDSERMLVTRLDLEDEASITGTIDRVVTQFGGLDVLVNNAGFSLFGTFEATSRKKVQEQFAVNVFGVMDVIRAALPALRESRGAVVNVTSVGGIITVPLMSLYHSSKFALEGFSESIAYELASQGVAVKLVEPGAVQTNFMSRLYSEYQSGAGAECYDDYVARIRSMFEQQTSGEGTTSEQVADVILQAANDRSERLRYVVGEDFKPIVAMRREAGEDEYIRTMRGIYLPSMADT